MPFSNAWNNADDATAFDAMIACCGAKRWAAAMVALRPIGSVFALSEAADRVWSTMNESDWMEAFACHPASASERRHMPRQNPSHGPSRSNPPLQVLQKNVLAEIAEGNAQYEERYGFTYIVCATGKARKKCSLFSKRASQHRASELREARNSNARSHRFVWESGS